MIGPHSAPRARKSCAGDGAAQVAFGVAVAAGKLWVGEPENLAHLGWRPTQRQQAPGDPQVDDAPVGLREAVADVPALHTIPIDFRRYRRGHGDWGSIRESRGRRRRGPCSGRPQQRLGVGRENSLGLPDLHPRGVAGGCAPRGLLIGEAGEPSQVTPVGAGRIASISGSQQLAGSGRHRWRC
jgi:hypothetical protein